MLEDEAINAVNSFAGCGVDGETHAQIERVGVSIMLEAKARENTWLIQHDSDLREGSIPSGPTVYKVVNDRLRSGVYREGENEEN